jgi:hypothetical protein
MNAGLGHQGAEQQTDMQDDGCLALGVMFLMMKAAAVRRSTGTVVRKKNLVFSAHLDSARDKQTGRQTDGRMDRHETGWRWMDGWMDGWTDGFGFT